MNSSDTSTSGPSARLGFSDATAIIVGTVIGAGIYETTPLIASSTSNALELTLVFLAGGVCAMIGALCYAELASQFDRSGGDFEYLRAAYGPRAGFVFAWMMFWVVQPASVGATAYIFARYAAALSVTFTASDYSTLAAAAVIILTAANAFGLRSGATTQKALTAIKVLGILLLIGFGFSSGQADPFAAIDRAAPTSNWQLAFILVMYTYGGWNVIVLVASEIRDPRRNIRRSLLFGLAVVTFVYLMTVWAFETSLGHGALATSASVAADVASLALGRYGGIFTALLICVTCLATINATLLTNSRIFYAFGQRWSTYRWLGVWHSQFDAPLNALLAQSAIAVGLIFAFAGGSGSFQRLVAFSAPVFWVFFCSLQSHYFCFAVAGYLTMHFGCRAIPFYRRFSVCSAGLCFTRVLTTP